MRARWALFALLVGCSGQDTVVGGADAEGLIDGGLRDAREGLEPFDAAPAVDAATAGDDATPEAPLAAEAGPPHQVTVGEPVYLDGSASQGAVRYQWRFGDGRGWAEPSPSAEATAIYDTPGRYRATLTVFDAAGNQRTDAALITVTQPAVHTPNHDTTIAALDARTVVSLSTDAALLTLIDTETLSVRRRLETCPGPRRLAVQDGRVAVTCPEVDALWVIDATTGAHQVHRFRYGAAPFGVIARRGRWYVTLQGTGELFELRDGPALEPLARWPAVEDARGVAELPDGRFAVTRWRAPADAGQIVVLDPQRDVGNASWPLAFDPQLASDTEIGGVPTWLDQIVVSPTGAEAAIPALQANIGQGLFLNGEPLDFDLALRAVVAFVDPHSGEERFDDRKQFDGRGLASAAAWSPAGDFLYVAMRGSQTIERLDRLEGTPSGTLLDVGFAVDGLLVHAGRLWAEASLSREVVVYDVDAFDTLAEPVARVPLVDAEPLSMQHLLGKQLFNDSRDPRVSRDGYIACAHCHLDGDSDRLVWDFTDRGEGLRNTISLLGRAGTAHGPLHWSANFDEVQDFEHDMRGPFAGFGLMDEADFAASDTPFGAPKAGRSAELDAMAAYVTSLDTPRRSPYRTADGALTPAAQRGAAVFLAAGCAECHPGPRYTDSEVVDGQPVLHDVGTLADGSGQRLGGALPGLDTPTLIGVWDAPPYLHDGSAPSLDAVLGARNLDDLHGETTRLDAGERADLVTYLRSLDGTERP